MYCTAHYFYDNSRELWPFLLSIARPRVRSKRDAALLTDYLTARRLGQSGAYCDHHYLACPLSVFHYIDDLRNATLVSRKWIQVKRCIRSLSLAALLSTCWKWCGSVSSFWFSWSSSFHGPRNTILMIYKWIQVKQGARRLLITSLYMKTRWSELHSLVLVFFKSSHYSGCLKNAT